MKTHTRWKTWKSNPMKGERFFSEDIGGFFKITKLQDCEEYCKCAENGSGSHWFKKTRAFITTDEGLRYRVPYIWLLFHSFTRKGKRLSEWADCNFTQETDNE